MQIGVQTTCGERQLASGMRQFPGMRFDMEIAVMYRPADTTDTGPLAGVQRSFVRRRDAKVGIKIKIMTKKGGARKHGGLTSNRSPWEGCLILKWDIHGFRKLSCGGGHL